MVYAIAAFHDTGLCEGRERHHLVSGQIIRQDARLKEWFSPAQIETMAQAAEDHRASSDHEPRSIYGRIVAEADRDIDAEVVIRRTIQYGLANYPELDTEGQWQRFRNHMNDKYSFHGYIKLWIPGSPNEKNLNELRNIIAQPSQLRQYFDRVYQEETSA